MGITAASSSVAARAMAPIAPPDSNAVSIDERLAAAGVGMAGDAACDASKASAAGPNSNGRR